jgi:hypothetical protein
MQISKFPVVLQSCAANYEPSTLVTYLFELCSAISCSFMYLLINAGDTLTCAICSLPRCTQGQGSGASAGQGTKDYVLGSSNYSQQLPSALGSDSPYPNVNLNLVAICTACIGGNRVNSSYVQPSLDFGFFSFYWRGWYLAPVALPPTTESTR